jgi:hypothetical protein
LQAQRESRQTFSLSGQILYAGNTAFHSGKYSRNGRRGLASRPLVKLMIQAGFYNLPDWAFAKIGRPKPGALQRLAVEQAVKLAAQPIRAALKDGVAAHARRRVFG